MDNSTAWEFFFVERQNIYFFFLLFTSFTVLSYFIEFKIIVLIKIPNWLWLCLAKTNYIQVLWLCSSFNVIYRYNFLVLRTDYTII